MKSNVQRKPKKRKACVHYFVNMGTRGVLCKRCQVPRLMVSFKDSAIVQELGWEDALAYYGITEQEAETLRFYDGRCRRG